MSITLGVVKRTNPTWIGLVNLREMIGFYKGSSGGRKILSRIVGNLALNKRLGILLKLCLGNLDLL